MFVGSVSLIDLVLCAVLFDYLSSFGVFGPMLPMSLDFPFLIAHSVFSNVI